MATTSTKGITFYKAVDAPSLDDDGMMSPPDLVPEVYTNLDLMPLLDGSEVTVLFKGEGPNALSLVHAHFKAGFRLPRHTHSADCLYFVVSGQAIMGNRTIEAGDGFYVPAGAPYAYQAGPDGVQVLEFRSATSFDMKVLDKTVEKWQPIIDLAMAHHDQWLAEAADA
ncbi:cupin domain-containing protein [Aquihabitans sp. McL0605]|uniref:cupin domain-containing protein n=1 Tax=Aquihabitans sp. McL0605 TaxID=3415671 RepID=UPI003CF816AC